MTNKLYNSNCLNISLNSPPFTFYLILFFVIKLSKVNFPAPEQANERLEANKNRPNSYLLFVINSAFSTCTVNIATAIVTACTIAMRRVNNPGKMNKPPKNSALPANRAIKKPGVKPIDSINWTAPSNPYPPNYFGAPWAIKLMFHACFKNTFAWDFLLSANNNLLVLQ